MDSACEATPYPELTVQLSGYDWKARMNIRMLMTQVTLDTLRQFVRLYLRQMEDTPENLCIPAKILGWFEAAIPIAKKEWEAASRRYVHGWRLTDGYCDKEKRKIEAENRKLESKVKATKRAFEKLTRKKAVFTSECAKLRIRIVNE